MLAIWSDCTFDHEFAEPIAYDPLSPKSLIKRKVQAVFACVHTCPHAMQGRATCVHASEQEKAHGINWRDQFLEAINTASVDDDVKSQFRDELKAIVDTLYCLDRIRQASTVEFRTGGAGTSTESIYQSYFSMSSQIQAWSCCERILNLIDIALDLVGVNILEGKWELHAADEAIDNELMTQTILSVKEILKERYEKLKSIVESLQPIPEDALAV